MSSGANKILKGDGGLWTRVDLWVGTEDKEGV